MFGPIRMFRRPCLQPSPPFAIPLTVSTACGMPVAGTKRRLGFSAAGWTATTSKIFCGLCFLNRPRKLIPRWEDRARHILAEFRADYARNFRDGRVRSFVDLLRRESPLFDAAWKEHDVRHREGGSRVFNHPDEGRRHFIQHTFIPSERPDYKLVLLVPAVSSPNSASSK